jgi:hypothetical protein
MTSSLPIIGAMETMLLRLCKELGSTRGSVTGESVTASSTKMIYEYLDHAVFNFHRPIRGGLPTCWSCRAFFLFAAFLTECMIALHSKCVQMVEVMTALLYPFSWSLSFIDAPLFCNVKLVDPKA